MNRRILSSAPVLRRNTKLNSRRIWQSRMVTDLILCAGAAQKHEVELPADLAVPYGEGGQPLLSGQNLIDERHPQPFADKVQNEREGADADASPEIVDAPVAPAVGPEPHRRKTPPALCGQSPE